MSYIPQQNLRSVLSTEIPTFSISYDLKETNFDIDTITNYDSFWKSIIVRNFDPSNSIFYHKNLTEPFDIIPPLAERIIEGWGSFFQINTKNINTKFNGNMVIEMCKRTDALG